MPNTSSPVSSELKPPLAGDIPTNRGRREAVTLDGETTRVLETERVSDFVQNHQRADDGAARSLPNHSRFVCARVIEIGGGHHVRRDDVVAIGFGDREP